jgi:hypothetical protein
VSQPEQFPTELPRGHCEERSDEAIPSRRRAAARDCFAALAMTCPKLVIEPEPKLP